MKLVQIAAEPQLIKMTLDDEDTIKEYGESLEFYCHDRQPLEVFMKFGTQTANDPTKMIEVLRELILNEDGSKVLTGNIILPNKVMVRVMNKIMDQLGK